MRLFYHDSFIIFELWVTAFSVFLVLFSIWFSMNSPVYIFLNMYSLEIYLVQRIPMILLQGKVSPNLLYFILSFIITFVLALIWKKIYEFLDKKI